jgi:hypothetical protein
MKQRLFWAPWILIAFWVLPRTEAWANDGRNDLRQPYVYTALFEGEGNSGDKDSGS